jgi:hypothetical protein
VVGCCHRKGENSNCQGLQGATSTKRHADVNSEKIVEMLKERREKMQESGKKGLGLIRSIAEEHLPHFQ